MASQATPPLAGTATSPGRPLVRPLRTALAIAGGYLGVSACYILVSGRLAALLSSDKASLESVERLKGCAFVAVTGALLFLVIYGFLKRLSRREQEISAHRLALVAAERRAAAGLFASSVAHDLNNLIMVYEYTARALTEPAQQGEDVPELARQLRVLNADLRGFANRLRMVSGATAAAAEDMDLAVLVKETVALARSHRRAAWCRFEAEGPVTAPFRGQPALLRQALLNLLLNAADATGNHGSVRVVTRDVAPGQLVIEVHDNGPGVPPEIAERVGQPLFTTKPDGTGLGLLSVRFCAEQHGGRLDFGRSETLGGAVFRLWLRRPTE